MNKTMPPSTPPQRLSTQKTAPAHTDCGHTPPALPALPHEAHIAQAAAMCAALSNPAQLRLLLWLLASPEGELCVSQLMALEQAKLSSISARLQKLHAARLLRKRREAKHVYYALADEHVRTLLHNLSSHAAELTHSH